MKLFYPMHDESNVDEKSKVAEGTTMRKGIDANCCQPRSMESREIGERSEDTGPEPKLRKADRYW